MSAVHVRRTDYAKSNGFHNMLDMDYYDEAISNIGSGKYVIFSDDIEWCRRSLKFKNLFFVEGNSSWEDLFLMSLCNNNIMANSTFSWWAAFLNKNKNKRIIFPSKWFGKKCKHKTNDMFPTSWESA